jgi:hydroxymethylglutaryl-CoA lyase
MTSHPRRLYLQEVATRDGFQNESVFVPTDDKVALVDALSDCGFAKIEVTSFTSPKAIPALRDAEAVMHRITRKPGVLYSALVPNLRGAERSLECDIDEANLVMSMSETHNRANLRMTRGQSFAQLRDVIAVMAGGRARVNVSLSTAFGCPMEGDVDPAEVMRWMAQFAELGVRAFSLCDTTGMAYPSQIRAVCSEAIARYPGFEFTVHLHNTRGMALANALAAIDVGIDRFDASLAGIGGCPYAPGATGNVCTEDLVHMLALEGFETSMDLDKLLVASARLAALVGHDVPSQILRAGHRLVTHPAPAGMRDFDAASAT